MERLKTLMVLMLLVAYFGTMKAQDETTPATQTTTASPDPEVSQDETTPETTEVEAITNATVTEETTAHSSKVEPTNSPNTTAIKEDTQDKILMEIGNIIRPTTMKLNSTSTVATTTDIMDLMTYMQDDNIAGDRFNRPKTHRHVKAHDGFHDIKNEKKWAHWNDAFTTQKK